MLFKSDKIKFLKIFIKLKFYLDFLKDFAKIKVLNHRNNAVGLSNSISHGCSALVPFILDLDQHVPWLPNTLFGALSLTSAAVTLLLPETKDVKMIDSLDEAISFYNEN